MTQDDEEHDDGRVEGMFGTIGEQKDEAFYDDRSDADDDLMKGRIRFPKGKLYGRDDELAKLRSSYKVISRRGRESKKEEPNSPSPSSSSSAVIFIAGYSGIGKSALVKELVKQLQEQSSPFMFASGKYSELRAETPFSAIAEAIGKIASQVINGDAGELQQVRDKLKAAGVADGDGGEVLIGMFPILSQLLKSGDQHQIEQASASASGTSTNHDMEIIKYVLQQLMRAVCTERRPVVLFIDDLQWADDASLEVLTALLLDKSLGHFMFIGAYRSNEVGEEHSLHKKILEIKESRGETTQVMELFNLSTKDIGEFIADSVDKSEEEVRTITEVVYNRTMGNIFFVIQAMEELVRKNALYYDVMSFEWQWNMSKVELESSLSDDLIKMVQSKMQTLPKTLQRTLAVAAHTRDNIDAETLHAILEAEGTSTDMQELLNLLDRAVSEGLMSNFSGPCEYAFAHDKIQEAAYSSVSPGEDRDKLLVRIATVLVDCSSSTGDDWMLFVAVHHFNSVPKHYVSPTNLAELNLRVAKLSLSKAAFSQAVELLRAGVACLDKDRWQNYKFCLELFNHLLETEYALGNYDLAEVAIEEVLDNTASIQDKFIAHSTLMHLLGAKDSKNYALALEKTLEILKVYGEDFPIEPSKIDLWRERIGLRLALKNRPLVALATYPVMKDDSLMKLFALLSIRANHAKMDKLSAMASLKAMRISCSKGISKSLPGFALNLGLRMRISGKFKKAGPYANLAISLMDRFQEDRGEEYALSLFRLHTVLVQLRRSFKDSMDALLESQKIGLSYGSIDNGLAAAMIYSMTYLTVGFPLTSLFEQKLILYEDLSREHHRKGFILIFQFLRQFVLNLSGKSNETTVMAGPVFDEETTLGRLEGNSRTMTIRDVSIFRLQLAYIFDDPATMEEMLERLAPLPMFDRPIVREHLRLSFVGLAALTLGRIGENKFYLNLGLKIMKYFQKLHRDCGSVNAYPIYLCLKAVKRPSNSTYDAAILACSNSELMHLQAIMTERYGIFSMNEKNGEMAKRHLTTALWLYHDWGALAKVDQLKKQHEFLREAVRSAPPSKLSSIVRRANKGGSIVLRAT